MFFLTILTVTILILVFYQYKSLNYWKLKNVKYLKPNFLFGNHLSVLLQRESFFDYIRRLYEESKRLKYFGFYQLRTPTLLIRDLDLIRKIAVEDCNNFMDHHSFIDGSNEPLWTENLLQLKGSKWKEMRANLSPSFTATKIKAIWTMINEIAMRFIGYHQDQQKDVLTVDVRDIFARYTNDVIANCIYGVECDSLLDRTNEFYTNGRELVDFTAFGKNFKLCLGFISSKLQRLIKPTLIPDVVSKYFNDIIDQTIYFRKTHNIIRSDMIHLLMKNEKLTVGDITAQALLAFSAGSVSTAMTFMAYELAMNQNVQKKLQDEIDFIYAQCGEMLTYELMSEMNYLDMVVSETLRKWPPFLMTDRVCTKTYTIKAENADESDLIIEEGDTIIFPIVGLHYDETLYPEPEQFNPERFGETNKHNINSYGYLPFGCGPRTCLGSRFALFKLKIFMYHLLSKYDIIPVNESTIPATLGKQHAVFAILQAENKMHFGFARRLQN